jgi:hypothetical protein
MPTLAIGIMEVEIVLIIRPQMPIANSISLQSMFSQLWFRWVPNSFGSMRGFGGTEVTRPTLPAKQWGIAATESQSLHHRAMPILVSFGHEKIEN